MNKFVPFLAILFASNIAGAQLISRFNWETNPVTKADFGPNGISVSSYATDSTGGAKGTNGINPGNGRYDINLVLSGSYYNVSAIDISVDFRREESQASFYYRGNYFNFGMNGGSLGVNFQLGSSIPVTVNSGNIINVPDDHIFHHYRFSYDDNTGIAKVWVDTTVVYTYTGTAGTPLYWTGAGDVTIGKDMDANGRNLTILDNLVIQKYANALLPVELLSFTAAAENNFAVVNWSTTKEASVVAYSLERSSNGAVFSSIKTLAASKGYLGTNQYHCTDSTLTGTLAYYRLKMVNANGSFTYSSIQSVSLSQVSSAQIGIFPNPAVDYVIIKLNNAVAGKYIYTVNAINGQVIAAAAVQVGSGNQQIKIDLATTSLKAVLAIKLSNVQTGASESFTIIKKS